MSRTNPRRSVTYLKQIDPNSVDNLKQLSTLAFELAQHSVNLIHPDRELTVV